MKCLKIIAPCGWNKEVPIDPNYPVGKRIHKKGDSPEAVEK